MDFSNQNELPKNFLEGIMVEVKDELDNDEPPCLTTLRSTSELDFRYEILGEMDQGGMKTIYKAIDRQTRRYVALAFIKTDSLSEKDLRYFIQEAWITARLEHPNIVPIHDIGLSPEGDPYFAMKLLSGENLRSILGHLKDGDPDYCAKFTERHLLDIFIKICDAVSYAHECGVIHLDLKPDNIQISDFGQVLVMDWGIASLSARHEYPEDDSSSITILSDFEQTMFGAIKGTPGYIAPELIDNSRRFADHKADVFGLGAILYSMLTFRRPHADTSKHCRETLNLFEIELQMNISFALKFVVDRAMSRNPEGRYDNVNDLKLDIESYLEGHATQAEDAGFWRQQKLLIKRNVRFFTTVFVAFFLIMIISTSFVFKLAMSEKRAVENEKRAVENEKIALYQKKLATEREEEALVLLQRYQSEKIQRERREKTSVKFYTIKASSALQNCNLSYAYVMSHAALKMDPNHKKTLNIIFNVLLSQQKFNKILEDLPPKYFDSAKYELVRRYAKVKPDSRLFTDDELYDYVDDLEEAGITRNILIATNIFNVINKGHKFFGRKRLIRDFFSIVVPHTRLVYSRKKDHLQIIGNTTKALSILAGLSFRGLDISKTKIHDSRILGTFKDLEYLDARGANINHFYSITSLSKLRYLNLENALISDRGERGGILDLNYLNLARTSLSQISLNHFNIEVLNVADAFQLDLNSIVKSSDYISTLVVSSPQIEDYPHFRKTCRKNGIDLVVVKRASQVDEDELLADLK